VRTGILRSGLDAPVRALPLVLILACALSAPRAAGASADLAIVGATLIDVRQSGHSTADQPDSAILIHEGVIVAAGARGEVHIPRGTRIVRAAGQYAVPGLIDGFGSMRKQGFADAYLYEGVTSVYVVAGPAGGDGEQLILDTARGPRLLRAASISGYLPEGAVPSDHPWTEHRLHDPRKSKAELVSEVDQLAAQGMRGLLISFDVWPDQLDTILEQARRRGLATSIEPAFTSYPYAIRAGVAALIRNDRYLTSLATPQELLAYSDDPMGRGGSAAYRAVCHTETSSAMVLALAEQLAESKKTALMPILSIEATADDVGAPNPWLSRSAVFVQPGDLDDPVDPKSGSRPYLEAHPERREALRACARRRQEIDATFHRLGVTYLAGSGAPAFGIMPGGGLHQELALLHYIGLSPREALAAATSNFADIFGWADIGRLESGRAGDVLLLGSDPRLDVTALDDIRTVVHEGQVIDRQALTYTAASRRAAAGAY
jgi:hypothetical protein